MTLPQNLLNLTEIDTTQISKNIITTDPVIHKTPFINFENKNMVLSNGNPKMISDVEAVKQWIILFITTPIDVYPIYAGTGFGTSIKKLFGKKQIGYGYEEALIEDEIKTGFLLCPAIEFVQNVEIQKEGKYLSISVQVQLKDGSLITETVEDVLKVRI